MPPALGVSKPASMRNNVDLPQPEGPSRAKISPRAIEIDTSSTAATSSKRLVSRSTGSMTLKPRLERRVQARAQPPDIVVHRIRWHQLCQILFPDHYRVIDQ